MGQKVKCINNYNDLQLGKLVEKGEQLTVTRERADTLTELNLVKIIEVIKEDKKEDKKKPTKRVEKSKK